MAQLQFGSLIHRCKLENLTITFTQDYLFRIGDTAHHTFHPLSALFSETKKGPKNLLVQAGITMRTPITEHSNIVIRGKYLYSGEGKNRQRFLMKGIAFPTPPPSQTQNYYSSSEGITDENLDDESYLMGWISVLEQLANDSDVNTIRLYEIDCRVDYSSFITRAAELGIYVLIPLTTTSGPGVLSRTNVAPFCYPKELFQYGASCIQK